MMKDTIILQDLKKNWNLKVLYQNQKKKINIFFLVFYIIKVVIINH